jgi:hypothetical protein
VLLESSTSLPERYAAGLEIRCPCGACLRLGSEIPVARYCAIAVPRSYDMRHGSRWRRHFLPAGSMIRAMESKVGGSKDRPPRPAGIRALLGRRCQLFPLLSAGQVGTHSPIWQFEWNTSMASAHTPSGAILFWADHLVLKRHALRSKNRRTPVLLYGIQRRDLTITSDSDARDRSEGYHHSRITRRAPRAIISRPLRSRIERGWPGERAP